MKLWKFLTTDIREFNLKRTEEVTKAGSDTAKAVLDLAKTAKEQGLKVEGLKDYVGEMSSLLDVLNFPLAQIVKDTIPFAPLAISILKLVAEATTKEPTLEQCMMLVSQTAYLESLRSILQPDLKHLEKKQAEASTEIAQELKALGDEEFDRKDAEDALLNFPNSKLAQKFNAVLKARLQETGLSEAQADRLSDRIAWNTPRLINEALASNADTLKPLAELHRNGSREVLERYESIDIYLNEKIKPGPHEKVFTESFTFRDIYIRLKAQHIKDRGEPDQEKAPVNLAYWATALLNDTQRKDKVLFIQGGPGCGKSLFCRMFADSVRRSEYPRWIPILIRLRDIRVLEKDFEETLRKAVDRNFAKNGTGWLTDPNVRFLFLLDGFDELLMEGRTSREVAGFLRQAGRFQESCKDNSEQGHRILITGTTLCLQGIERRLPFNLERVAILPLDQALQDKWFGKWQELVGQQKATEFQTFLYDRHCPERIRGSKSESGLAQEPLLLYLLAAMHRDGMLTPELFADVEAAKVKVLIYEQSLDWVLTKQCPEWLNRDLAELETKSLRRILAEAGLCVVQTGGECAPISMIEERLKGDDNAKNLLEAARTRLKDNLLRNVLAAFYLQPARSGEGAVEFAHKSFGEFLCAERLKEALEDWTHPGIKGQEFYVPAERLHWEIYDLLGQPVLTQEIVEYLRALLFNSPDFQPIALFRRLHEFYDKWCEGEFIDAPPAENWPQKKMTQLKALLISTGLRQVDVYTGLNVLILLLEIYRYTQTQENLKDAITFYPGGQPLTEAVGYGTTTRLLRVIHYSDSIGQATFTHIAGRFIASTNLENANLDSANLENANLENANLSSANLSSANLENANLESAHLYKAHLYSTYLPSANLTCAFLMSADLGSANLENANLDSANLENANLDSANLNSANLTSTNLYDANLAKASLYKANLYSAYLDSAYLVSAYLVNAYLVSAHLESANLTRANLDSANLTSASLYKANLYSANLDSANLYGANLYGANLIKADLVRANLEDADLRSANLTNANLTNADLGNITWNETTKWERVTGLETARNVPKKLKEQWQRERCSKSGDQVDRQRDSQDQQDDF